MSAGHRTHRWAPLFAMGGACFFLAASPAAARVDTRSEDAATGPSLATPSFKVLAFYRGTWDAAHIDFIKEANQWFPQAAEQHGFSYTATTNWDLLNPTTLAQYQVVMFLDDQPQSAAQRSAFQQYMQNGGGWMGFHVSAFTTSPDSWSWYHHQFLGSGAFRTNTWGPTTAVLKVENRTHPSTTALPATFTSAVSEWYGWSNNLRGNADIQVLASVDPVSFPLGTDPNQSPAASSARARTRRASSTICAPSVQRSSGSASSLALTPAARSRASAPGSGPKTRAPISSYSRSSSATSPRPTSCSSRAVRSVVV